MTSNNERVVVRRGELELRSQILQRVRQNSVELAGPTYTTPKWLVKNIASQIPEGAPLEGSKSPLPFFHLLERLKTTPREGWRRLGLNNGESISDHMYRMAMMTMFLPESLASKVDVQRCTKMALVHDMAEVLVGDITPVEGVSKAEKNRRETTTMDYLTKNILGNVNGGKAAADLRVIWQEYEDGETLESKCVHDIDKVELILQMIEYERTFKCNYDFGVFTWVVCKILLPEIKDWAHAILDEREKLWCGREHISYTPIGDPVTIEAEMLSMCNQLRESDSNATITANGHTTINNSNHFSEIFQKDYT